MNKLLLVHQLGPILENRSGHFLVKDQYNVAGISYGIGYLC